MILFKVVSYKKKIVVLEIILTLWNKINKERINNSSINVIYNNNENNTIKENNNDEKIFKSFHWKFYLIKIWRTEWYYNIIGKMGIWER